MKSKKLNLDQLKVKSFITNIDMKNQIAAKGGATYDKAFDSCVLDEVIVEGENELTQHSCASCRAQDCH